MAVPFRVVGHPDANKPVYTVVPVDASQAPKNIHRMELRPCGPGESANLGLEELAEPVTEEAQEHSEGEALAVSESEQTEEESPMPLTQPRQSRRQQAARHTNPFRRGPQCRGQGLRMRGDWGVLLILKVFA